MGHHREEYNRAIRDIFTPLGEAAYMAVKHANKTRWSFDGDIWLMNRMAEFPRGGGQMLYEEPPQWAAEAIAMLRMVEANKEVPGLGFRYNDDIFYIDGELEKNDQTQ